MSEGVVSVEIWWAVNRDRVSGLVFVFNSFGFNGTLYRIVSNLEMEEQGDGSWDV